MDTPTTDTITVETVLPRPVDELPAPALAPATRKLADKLIDNFDMSDETATTWHRRPSTQQQHARPSTILSGSTSPVACCSPSGPTSGLGE